MTFNILLQFRCSSRLSAERARPLPLSSVSKQKIACGKPSIIRIESSNQFHLLRKILEQTRWWNWNHPSVRCESNHLLRNNFVWAEIFIEQSIVSVSSVNKMENGCLVSNQLTYETESLTKYPLFVNYPAINWGNEHQKQYQTLLILAKL